jgi:predicted membrane protein
MIVAILNGAIRVMSYGKFMTEVRAHQLSTLTGTVIIGIVVWKINKYYPMTSGLEAIKIGFIWLVMTILFEFGFGHYVMKRTWEILFRDYRIDKGRLWVFFLIWIVVAPLFIYTYF